MRSIIPADEPNTCYLCNLQNVYTEVHHCLHGSKRKLADEDGLTVHLCMNCHRKLHDIGVGDLYLEQEAEDAWLRTHPGATIEDFIKRYGKNYKDESDDKG